MALVNKNQMAGKRGGDARNKYCNGGEENSLGRYNGANVGALWKTKSKHKLKWKIKRKGQEGGFDG